MRRYWLGHWHVTIKAGGHATDTVTIGINPTGSLSLVPRFNRRTVTGKVNGLRWLGIKVWWLRW